MTNRGRLYEALVELAAAAAERAESIKNGTHQSTVKWAGADIAVRWRHDDMWGLYLTHVRIGTGWVAVDDVLSDDAQDGIATLIQQELACA